MADGNDNVIGLAMQLDVSNIKEGVKAVNDTIKQAGNEFKLASAGMGKWSDTSEGLNAKLKQLGKVLSAQEKLVKGYEAEIQRVSEKEGDHSVELEKLNEKLQKAQASVKQTTSDISHYGEVLEEVTERERAENSSLGKLSKTIERQKKSQSVLVREYQNAVIQYGKNSREAKKLEMELRKVNSELSKSEGATRKATKAVEQLGRSFNDIQGRALKKSISTLKSLAGVVAGLGAGFLATAEVSRKVRKEFNYLNDVFDRNGLAIEKAKEAYQVFYGILGDSGQATKMVDTLGRLSQTETDLAKWTNIAAGVMREFGDSVSVTGLAEQALETAKVGEATKGLDDVLVSAGYNLDDFNHTLSNLASEEERADLITRALNASYGEAGKGFNKINSDIIEANETLAQNELRLAELGKKAEPIMNGLKRISSQLLDDLLPIATKVISFVENHTPLVIAGVTAYTVALGALTAVEKYQDIVVAKQTITLIAHTVASKTATLTAKALTVAQGALNAVMSANPVMLVVLAVGALVAGFVALWNKSEKFRAFWKNLWKEIEKTAKTVATALTKVFQKAGDSIKKAFEGLKNFFVTLWSGIQKVFGGVVEFYTGIFKTAFEAIIGIFGGLVSFFAGIKEAFTGNWKDIPKKLLDIFTKAYKNIFSVFGNLGKKLLTIGHDVIMNLKNGVLNAIPEAVKALKGAGEKLVGALTAPFKSKGEEAGKALVDGLTGATSNATSEAKKSGNKLVDEIIKSETERMLLGSKKYARARKIKTDEVKKENEAMKKSIKDTANTLEEEKPILEKAPTKKNWIEWFEILSEVSMEGVKNGTEASSRFLAKMDEAYSYAEQRAKEFGQEFDVSKTLEEQNKAIAKLVDDLMSIPADEIPAVFEWTDKSITALADRYKKNSEQIIKDTDAVEGDIIKASDKIKQKLSEVLNAFDKMWSYASEAVYAFNELANAKADAFIDRIAQEIEVLRNSADEAKKIAQDAKDEELDELTRQRKQMLITEYEYQERKFQSEKNLKDKLSQIEQEKANQEKLLQEEANRRSKEQFEANKRLQIAMVWVNAGTAIARAFAENFWAVALGISAMITATASAQTATIASQQWTPPALAKGGIVDKGTLALIGENGREAVLPLENNTEWISELADKLAVAMKRSYAVDGYPSVSYARRGAETVNNFYTQNINAPKTPNRRELYRDTKNLLSLKG